MNHRAPLSGAADQAPQDDRPQVDRSAIRRLLKLTAAERARLAVTESRNLEAFNARVRRR